MLAGGILLLGPTPAVPIALNLFAFVISSLFIYDVARRMRVAELHLWP